jgi:hypothetical protein
MGYVNRGNGEKSGVADRQAESRIASRKSSSVGRGGIAEKWDKTLPAVTNDHFLVTKCV